jgi:hypothetical protein
MAQKNPYFNPPSLPHSPSERIPLSFKLHKSCTIAKKLLWLKATCLNPQNTVFTIVPQWQKPLFAQKISTLNPPEGLALVLHSGRLGYLVYKWK